MPLYFSFIHAENGILYFRIHSVIHCYCDASHPVGLTRLSLKQIHFKHSIMVPWTQWFFHCAPFRIQITIITLFVENNYISALIEVPIGIEVIQSGKQCSNLIQFCDRICCIIYRFPVYDCLEGMRMLHIKFYVLYVSQISISFSATAGLYSCRHHRIFQQFALMYSS